MTGPREWRHAEDCSISAGYDFGCRCGLSAVRDAIAAGHRVVIGPDGVEGRLRGGRGIHGECAFVVPLENSDD